MPAALAVVPAVAAIGSAVIGANASKKASQDQFNAMNAANSQNAAQTQVNMAPMINTGQQASAQLQSGMGQGGSLGRQFTMADFQTSPGYNWDVNQAMKAIGNSASARGGALSGMGVSDQIKYASNMANNSYGQAQNAFMSNQKENSNLLSSLQNQGIGAAEGLGRISQSSSAQNQEGAAYGGNAQAAGTIGSSKALQSGFNGVMNGIGSYFNTPNTNTGNGGIASPGTIIGGTGQGLYPMYSQFGPQQYQNINAGE
jgi:hypothetical protein